jgi:hypothetical protein
MKGKRHRKEKGKERRIKKGRKNSEMERRKKKRDRKSREVRNISGQSAGLCTVVGSPLAAEKRPRLFDIKPPAKCTARTGDSLARTLGKTRPGKCKEKIWTKSK